MGPNRNGATAIIMAVMASKLIIVATANGATAIIMAVVATKLEVIGATVITAATVALNTINKFVRLRGDLAHDNRNRLKVTGTRCGARHCFRSIAQ